MDSSVLSDIAALQQQRIQQLQQHQLIAGGNLPSPLDTGGPAHLHSNSLSLGGAGELPSTGVLGVMPAVSLSLLSYTALADLNHSPFTSCS